MPLPTGLVVKKGIEYARQVGFGDTRSVIGHFHHNVVSFFFRGHGDGAAGFSMASSALFTRLRKTCCISVSEAEIGGKSFIELGMDLYITVLRPLRGQIDYFIEHFVDKKFPLSASLFCAQNSTACG